MRSVSAHSEVKTCFPILPHTLHHRYNCLHTGNTRTRTDVTKPSFLIRPSLPLCFHLLVLLLCNAAQSPEGNLLEELKAETFGFGVHEAHAANTPIPHRCLHMYHHAYSIPCWPCWLFFLFMSFFCERDSNAMAS